MFRLGHDHIHTPRTVACQLLGGEMGNIFQRTTQIAHRIGPETCIVLDQDRFHAVLAERMGKESGKPPSLFENHVETFCVAPGIAAQGIQIGVMTQWIQTPDGDIITRRVAGLRCGNRFDPEIRRSQGLGNIAKRQRDIRPFAERGGRGKNIARRSGGAEQGMPGRRETYRQAPCHDPVSPSSLRYSTSRPSRQLCQS
ncbi:MAG: hypothetical protein IPL00_10210 [Gammaproteobacteria bacterium]|nr:hypothetical protein [Gammaproteobacteria bacterium]